ncbi:6-bladed beta-propeller [Echinicola salinicaeni]|uniref:6-bladed beta-propeller n=1 Tax=Echinicola salinicaeni TaxID=2762757 RepID=UPI0016478FCB|nr:6-bladed beta-propeller [Echinicola salinicaeni]
MKNIIISFFVLGCIYSCKEKEAYNGKSNLIEIRIPDQVKSAANLDSILEFVEVKKLDIPLSHYIGNPHFFLSNNEDFIAADLYGSNRIIKLGENGSFKNQVLDVGDGPDKYNNVHTVLIGKDNYLMLYEGGAGRFVLVDSSSQVMDRVKMDYSISNGVYSSKFGVYCFYSNFGLNYPDNFRVSLFDQDLKEVNKFFKDGPKYKKLPCLKVLMNNFSVTPKGDVLFYEAYSDTIYQLSSKKDFVPKYRVQFPNNQTYEKVLREAKEVMERDYNPYSTSEMDKFFQLYSGFYETERYIAFNIEQNKKIYFIIVDKLDGYKVLHCTSRAVSIAYKCILPPAFHYHDKGQKFIAILIGHSLKTFFESGSKALEGFDITDEDLYMVSYSFKKE